MFTIASTHSSIPPVILKILFNGFIETFRYYIYIYIKKSSCYNETWTQFVLYVNNDQIKNIAVGRFEPLWWVIFKTFFSDRNRLPAKRDLTIPKPHLRNLLRLVQYLLFVLWVSIFGFVGKNSKNQAKMVSLITNAVWGYFGDKNSLLRTTN